jgi:hypothetical protein
MKKFSLVLGLLFAISSANAFAATTVSGDQLDARWTLAGSPYEVQGQTAIPAGVSVLVEPGVQIVFAANASLDVNGSLVLQGTAAYPILVDMRAGGMASRLWVKGGEVRAFNAKFIGGVLASMNGKLVVEASEIARGGGPYLMGHTTAVFKNNKIYGNASGATLDGENLQADFQYNTLVQNTYGLQYKKAASLKFFHNSVRDNSLQVSNASDSPITLGGNFWGTTDPSAIKAKGQVDFGTPVALKDILRAYVKTQLPSLPVGKSASVAKQARAERAAVKANARKADAMRKTSADAILRAERAKKLADEKAARAAKLKEQNEKLAAERKAKAEELARKKAEAAEALRKAQEEKAAARKATAEKIAAEKAEAAKTAAEKVEAVKAVAEKATAAELDLSGGVETPVPTPVPTEEPTLVVPAPPVQESPSAGPDAAPAAPAQPALEIPDVPLGDTLGASVMDIPAPPTDSFSPADIPAPPSGGAPEVSETIVQSPAPAPAPPASEGPPAIPDGDLGPPPDFGGLDLPPMSDQPGEAPKDMELPPVDDLGNLNLDLK